MRVYLERIDPASAMARFYFVAVVPTLFGNWAVIREWGRIGQTGTVREEAFDAEADAVRSADAHIIRKRRGGYGIADRDHTGKRRPAASQAPSHRQI